MSPRPLLAALALCCVAPTLAAQSTWFVDAAAAGPGTGTALDPFPTIQQGVAAATSGDTVQVAAGAYAGMVSVAIDDLEIAGAGPGLSVLDATGQDAGFSAVSISPAPRIQDLRIAGFTVQNASRAQALLRGCDRPVLEDLELLGLGRNVPSPAPGTGELTGLLLAEVADANVARVIARANYAAGVAIEGASSGNALRDLTLSDNAGDGTAYAAIELRTSSGANSAGGANAASFAGSNTIAGSPAGIALEDSSFGAIDLDGGATFGFTLVAVPLVRSGLGTVNGLDAFLDAAALGFRLTGGEPLLPSREAYFADFAATLAAALAASAPSSALLFDRTGAEYVVAPGLSLQHALDAVPLASRIFAHPGRYTGPFRLSRSVELLGAQRGVDARGRVTGALDPLLESILQAPGGVALNLRAGAAGATIAGFAFEAGSVFALEATGGPLDGLEIRECHFQPGIVGPIRFGSSGADVDFEKNVVRSAAATGPAIALSSTALLPGLRFRANHVLRVGSPNNSDSGFFADRRAQVSASPGRSPEFTENRFEGHGTGISAGPGAIHDALIADNVFVAQRLDGASGGFQDCTFRGNLFDGNGESGLFLTGFGGATDPSRGAQRCLVIDNVFQGHGGEALFFSSLQFPGTIATNAAHGNSFIGNGAGAAYYGTESIDATLNWWGDARGPSGNGPGTGEAVFGVAFDPWLSCAPGAGSYPAGDAAALAVADLNADGVPDLAIADRAGDAVHVRWNNGLGSFPTEQTIALLAGDAPRAIDVGEVLPSSARGIAVACDAGPRVRLVDVSTGPVQDLALPGLAPIALRVLPLDGPANDDLAVALEGDTLGSAGIAVALGSGSFALLPGPMGGAWPAVRSLAALDVDGDLDLDLAALVAPNGAQPLPPGDLVIYRNDGLGGFTYDAALALVLAPGEQAIALAAGDLDRDGRLDLVASVRLASAGRLVWFRNAGAGSFAAPVNTSTTYAPGALVLGDLRDDTQPGFFVDTEVAVLAPDLGLVAIHGGFDGSAFHRFEACSAGSHPTAIAMRNLELVDCLPDLVTTDDAGASVHVHLTPASALARTYGVGCAGISGVPRARGIGKPIFGSLTFAVGIEDAAALAPVALMTGVGTGPGTCGGFLLDLPLFFFPGFSNASGATALGLPIPADPFIECAQLYMQWIVIDPAGTFLGGPFALSDGIRVRVGD